MNNPRCLCVCESSFSGQSRWNTVPTPEICPLAQPIFHEATARPFAPPPEFILGGSPPTLHKFVLLFTLFAGTGSLLAQDAKAPVPGASSVIEDRKAKQMIEAGDARYDANEIEPAIELYKAAIDRYPASKWRYLAHLKIGKHAFLKDRKL